MRILMLDLDTTRPDHLGCYGYHRNTSPNIDRIAEEGVRFDNYYCSDAPCLPSRSALFSGRFGIHTGVVGHAGTSATMRLGGAARGFRDRLREESLTALLRRKGLHTATISSFAERHSAWWFYAEFNEAHNCGQHGWETADAITPLALKWIEDNAARENWFLHVNYWDAHMYYRAPESFGNPFARDPVAPWITPEVLEEHRKHVGPSSASEMSFYTSRPYPQYPRHQPQIRDLNDLRRHFDGYDCSIAYMDRHIGRLFDALRKWGLMDDLVVIVTADHGENQGELGIYGNHSTSDCATHRIPMIVRWPGMISGRVDRGLHYHLDLAPTLAELFGADRCAAWDGQSFAPALTSGRDCGRDYLVLGQCAQAIQRSVRWSDYHYIRTYHDGHHLFPKEMLFDLAQDPHEQEDLARARPDLCREAVHRMTQWHDEMMASMPPDSPVDPLWIALHEGGPFHARGQLRDYLVRLEQTGRGHAVEELKRRHPGELR